jgi:fumarate reductase subunit D
MSTLRALWAYLRARLDERSTWLLIGAGCTAAAALAWPWNVISFVVAVIGALVPSGGGNDA